MNIDIVSVPLYYGCDRWGVQFAPQTLMDSQLTTILKKRNTIHNQVTITVETKTEDDKFKVNKDAKFLDAIVNTSKELRDAIYHSLASNNFPLTLGGDHSLAAGSLAGVLKYDRNTRVIWVDAHTDINTHLTSPSGNVHGMPVASSLNLGHPLLTNIFDNFLDPANILYIGVRDIDAGEKEILDRYQIKTITIDDIHSQGMAMVISKINQFIERSPSNIHVSYDIDSLDKELVPGTGTPVANGLTLQQGMAIMETLALSKRITSLDFVEFNPELDSDNKTLTASLNLLTAFFTKEESR